MKRWNIQSINHDNGKLLKKIYAKLTVWMIKNKINKLLKKILLIK